MKFEIRNRISNSNFEFEFITYRLNLSTNIHCVLHFLLPTRKLLIKHHNVLDKLKGLQSLQNGANLDLMFTFPTTKVDGSSRSRAEVTLHTMATVI